MSSDLLMIQQPLKPFGVSWYQTDVNANNSGNGSAAVRGVFGVETFSVSPGGTTTFSPTHQYHLGLWFNNPHTPFKLGCEPGPRPRSSPRSTASSTLASRCSTPPSSPPTPGHYPTWSLTASPPGTDRAFDLVAVRSP